MAPRRASSEDEPTDPALWEKVKELARGERDELKGTKSPNDGAGFRIWPSAYAVGWCLATYKRLGGGWRKKKSALSLPPQHVSWTRSLREAAAGLGSLTAPPKLTWAVTASGALAVWEARVSLDPRNRRASTALAEAWGGPRGRHPEALTPQAGRVRRTAVAVPQGGGELLLRAGYVVHRADLDDWFKGHGGGDPDDRTRGSDWVAISPVRKTWTDEDGEEHSVKPGDILGPCGISREPQWKELTRDGKDPLKCMPRERAWDLSPAERAELAKEKLRRERDQGGSGKAPVNTPIKGEEAARIRRKAK